MTHDSGRAGQGSTGARPAGNPPEVERVFGFWALRGADGDGRCLISLSNLRRGADYGVQMEACDIAGLPKATGWRPTRDGFELIAGEETLLAFRQTGVDGFESLDGRYVMGRAPQV